MNVKHKDYWTLIVILFILSILNTFKIANCCQKELKGFDPYGQANELINELIPEIR